MRKIKLTKWKEIVPETNEEKEFDLFNIINMLINMAGSKNELPSGMEQFRTFSRINKAFEEAKNGVIVLEEKEYKFIKDLIEKHIPSPWGMNKDIMEVIDTFMDAKEE